MIYTKTQSKSNRPILELKRGDQQSSKKIISLPAPPSARLDQSFLQVCLWLSQQNDWSFLEDIWGCWCRSLINHPSLVWSEDIFYFSNFRQQQKKTDSQSTMAPKPNQQQPIKYQQAIELIKACFFFYLHQHFSNKKLPKNSTWSKKKIENHSKLTGNYSWETSTPAKALRSSYFQFPRSSQHLSSTETVLTESNPILPQTIKKCPNLT